MSETAAPDWRRSLGWIILCFPDSNHGKHLTCRIVPDFKCPFFLFLVVIAITQQTAQWFRVPFPSLWKRFCMLNTRPDPSEQAQSRDAEHLITAAQSSSPPRTWIKEVSICYYRAESHMRTSAGGFLTASCEMDAHTAAPNHTTQTSRDKPAPVRQETCGLLEDVHRTDYTYAVL